MTYLRRLLFAWMLAANAYSFSYDLNDNKIALADQCKQLALQLYTISSHQKLNICQANLDGLNVYYASNYIHLNWDDKAQEVLTAAIIQIKYALDIGCDEHYEIATIIKELEAINTKLNRKD